MGIIKSNIQYVSSGAGKPVAGDIPIWNGTDFEYMSQGMLGLPKLDIFGSSVSLNHVSPFNNLDDGLLNNAPVQVLQYFSQSGITGYNNSTGIWTCPSSSYYLINYYVQFDRNVDEYGWLHPVTGAGMLSAGIVRNTGAILIQNEVAITIPKRIIGISGTLMFNFSAGNSITLRVMNQTGYNYAQGTNMNSYCTMTIIKMS
ncbi:MAG: hypothetical protein Q8J88_00865 [Bacteroidales bacterium]|nr:hypothetical protein [Bacteroidales bacterium]